MRKSNSANGQPWQLLMFRRSLKKQLKLEALLAFTELDDHHDCLLITCGDNNGALNWHFRESGGRWWWADLMDEGLGEMEALLDEPVQHVSSTQLPFEDDQFDKIVAIDVLEHLEDDQPFLNEINRVLRPDGQTVITVPNGDPNLLANKVKWRVGMTPEIYGHTRAGYTVAELGGQVARAGLTPVGSGGYSRFFTEMMELIINFGYVFVLSRKKKGKKAGEIAPTTSGQLKTHGLAYKVYGLLFPLMRMVSRLDNFLPPETNNAVIVKAIKS